jgi:hypothetical protein
VGDEFGAAVIRDLALIAWTAAVVTWCDVGDAARAWWRRNVIRYATPEGTICNDCSEPDCTEGRRMTCPMLHNLNPRS